MRAERAKLSRSASVAKEDGYATELATAKITSADKERLRAMVCERERLASLPDRSRADIFQELQIGMDIHRVIAQSSSNEMPSGLLNGILDKCEHYVWMELLWLAEWRIARGEHSAIFETICAGDAAHAGELARKHIRGSRDNILRLLQAKSDCQSLMARAS